MADARFSGKSILQSIYTRMKTRCVSALTLPLGSIPLTACSTIRSGTLFCRSLKVSTFIPPGLPECLLYSFWALFLPVTPTFSALTCIKLRTQSLIWESFKALVPEVLPKQSPSSYHNIILGKINSLTLQMAAFTSHHRNHHCRE